MNRRVFLQRLMIPVVAATVVTAVPIGLFARLKAWYSKWQRERLIAEVLETPEGRLELARRMVEPIRRSLEYQGVGRELLMVDELPQGVYVRHVMEWVEPRFCNFDRA